MIEESKDLDTPTVEEIADSLEAHEQRKVEILEEVLQSKETFKD